MAEQHAPPGPGLAELYAAALEFGPSCAVAPQALDSAPGFQAIVHRLADHFRVDFSGALAGFLDVARPSCLPPSSIFHMAHDSPELRLLIEPLVLTFETLSRVFILLVEDNLPAAGSGAGVFTTGRLLPGIERVSEEQFASLIFLFRQGLSFALLASTFAPIFAGSFFAGLMVLVDQFPGFPAPLLEHVPGMLASLPMSQFPMRTRRFAYALLARLFYRHDAYFFNHGVDLADTFVRSMKGERDPRCLAVCFALAERVFLGLPAPLALARSPAEGTGPQRRSPAVAEALAGELFDVISVYFPISFTAPSGPGAGAVAIDVAALRQQLTAVFVAAARHGAPDVLLALVELLTEKIADLGGIGGAGVGSTIAVAEVRLCVLDCVARVCGAWNWGTLPAFGRFAPDSVGSLHASTDMMDEGRSGSGTGASGVGSPGTCGCNPDTCACLRAGLLGPGSPGSGINAASSAGGPLPASAPIAFGALAELRDALMGHLLDDVAMEHGDALPAGAATVSRLEKEDAAERRAASHALSEVVRTAARAPSRGGSRQRLGFVESFIEPVLAECLSSLQAEKKVDSVGRIIAALAQGSPNSSRWLLEATLGPLIEAFSSVPFHPTGALTSAPGSPPPADVKSSRSSLLPNAQQRRTVAASSIVAVVGSLVSVSPLWSLQQDTGDDEPGFRVCHSLGRLKSRLLSTFYGTPFASGHPPSKVCHALQRTGIRGLGALLLVDLYAGLTGTRRDPDAPAVLLLDASERRGILTLLAGQISRPILAAERLGTADASPAAGDPDPDAPASVTSFIVDALLPILRQVTGGLDLGRLALPPAAIKAGLPGWLAGWAPAEDSPMFAGPDMALPCSGLDGSGEILRWGDLAGVVVAELLGLFARPVISCCLFGVPTGEAGSAGRASLQAPLALRRLLVGLSMDPLFGPCVPEAVLAALGRLVPESRPMAEVSARVAWVLATLEAITEGLIDGGLGQGPSAAPVARALLRGLLATPAVDVASGGPFADVICSSLGSLGRFCGVLLGHVDMLEEIVALLGRSFDHSTAASSTAASSTATPSPSVGETPFDRLSAGTFVPATLLISMTQVAGVPVFEALMTPGGPPGTSLPPSLGPLVGHPTLRLGLLGLLFDVLFESYLSGLGFGVAPDPTRVCGKVLVADRAAERGTSGFLASGSLMAISSLCNKAAGASVPDQPAVVPFLQECLRTCLESILHSGLLAAGLPDNWLMQDSRRPDLATAMRLHRAAVDLVVFALQGLAAAAQAPVALLARLCRTITSGDSEHLLREVADGEMAENRVCGPLSSAQHGLGVYAALRIGLLFSAGAAPPLPAAGTTAGPVAASPSFVVKPLFRQRLYFALRGSLFADEHLFALFALPSMRPVPDAPDQQRLFAPAEQRRFVALFCMLATLAPAISEDLTGPAPRTDGDDGAAPGGDDPSSGSGPAAPSLLSQIRLALLASFLMLPREVVDERLYTVVTASVASAILSPTAGLAEFSVGARAGPGACQGDCSPVLTGDGGPPGGAASSSRHHHPLGAASVSSLCPCLAGGREGALADAPGSSSVLCTNLLRRFGQHGAERFARAFEGVMLSLQIPRANPGLAVILLAALHAIQQGRSLPLRLTAMAVLRYAAHRARGVTPLTGPAGGPPDPVGASLAIWRPCLLRMLGGCGPLIRWYFAEASYPLRGAAGLQVSSTPDGDAMDEDRELLLLEGGDGAPQRFSQVQGPGFGVDDPARAVRRVAVAAREAWHRAPGDL
ncbi:hypothetical protein H696_04490 [Fonticula alba]|uniref:MMS19 nucleotide excision repair protein n=1 Tax=Fonticula alba TaxID=691883 RepID=A0A058Z498_FONAL|nr:hypothetical protein H696_04490 [Fonticula alba]KCV69075.1 hypothetical protein H696_04490 [Fonticula alba]|eukprot:XP_009496646.1 hypothetical protein H696_04490 [Fonticula alba]